jgi:hypothetical protein
MERSAVETKRDTLDTGVQPGWVTGKVLCSDVVARVGFDAGARHGM